MATLAAVPSSVVDAGIRSDSDPFALGVASGDPAPDGFVIWTRLVGPKTEALQAPAVRVRYEVASDPNFRNIVRFGQGHAHPERAHSVHVEVAGLRAGRPYWYRFHAMGAVSPIGKACTAPRSTALLRLAVVSCQHWEQAHFGAYRDIVASDPDLILQLGDYIYEQSYPGVRVRDFGAPEPTDLEGYRRRHALYKTDVELQAAHRACPWVVTWDDHEVLNDYAALANREGLPPTLFALRRAAAYQAYFEHMPIRPSLWRGLPEPRLYRSVDWGDLASLSILDTRQYRSPPPCAPQYVARNIRLEGCPQTAAPEGTIMGVAQERWLADRLLRESRPWSLIAQQVFFAPLWLDGTRRATFSDQWDGYAANRARLIAQLARPGVRNPIVLSGDVHSFWINDVDGPEGMPVGSEIVTSALGAASPPPDRFGDVQANNPHVRFHDVRNAGWVRIDVEPTVLRAEVRVIEDRTIAGSAVRPVLRMATPSGSRRFEAG